VPYVLHPARSAAETMAAASERSPGRDGLIIAAYANTQYLLNH